MRPPDLSALRYCEEQQVRHPSCNQIVTENLAHCTKQFNPRFARHVQAARLGI